MSVVSTPPTSDSQLIAETLSGNERAFRDLVNRYSSLVYNFIYRMTGNKETADDMTQDVFVKIYKNLRLFDGNRPFKPWVLRIASNTTVSAMRKKVHPVTSLDALQEAEPWREWASENTPDPARQAEVRDSSRRVLQALETLEPHYKQVLLLRYQQDLSYEEIAQATETPLNTVRTWLKRGRDRLQQHVKELV